MKIVFLGTLLCLASIATSTLTSKGFLNNVMNCKATCREMGWEPCCKKKTVKDKNHTTAFHAVLSKSINSLAHNTIVQYKTVTANIGGCYDPDNGVFTAKEAGVYSFSWCFLTKKGGTVYLGGDVDGKIYSYAIIEHQASTWMSTCGHMIVTLKTGSKVSTKNNGKNVYLHGGYTYFTGHKL
ncbi:complement C1q-like protein 2 [Saccostrea echinata]|uniref:complement C1q-like protein 2 n=1 Tax=Saccostrea echinata TaxID=191078 RepID=UPI002A82E089|nr:complement C1q-like protein 2 [Saccostrea echinata]